MKTLLAHLSRSAWARSFFALFTGLLILSTATDALAAGRIVWKSTTLAEKTTREAWLLEMEIHLPSAPDIAHKSMKFEFTQTAEFERSLVDGREGPQETTIPLSNQQAIIETVTVGFMDPGSGKTQNRTRFSFKITRDHGYRAGTWSVKVRDTDSGNQIGQVSTLKLTGENPVVDRRSIVFQGGDKKKDDKKKEEKSAAPAEESAPSETGADESSAEDESMDAPPSEDEGQTPPSIEEKPGGGCHTAAPGGHGEWAWLLAGFALGGLALAWRRSRD